MRDCEVVVERVILHVKWLDDEAAAHPTVEGIPSGVSLRVVARELRDGRVRVSVTGSRRVHRLRASGKAFHYWQMVSISSLARTRQGLVVLRTINSRKPAKSNSTRHLFSGTTTPGRTTRAVSDVATLSCCWSNLDRPVRLVEGPRTGMMTLREAQGLMIEAASVADDEAIRLIGTLPVAPERFPLLEGTVHAEGLAVSGDMFFLDATDYRQVAANVFGATRVRRPLVRQVERLSRVGRRGSVLVWFHLFRGLVPAEWIAESMERVIDTDIPNITFTSAETRTTRIILRCLPQPVLRRILAEPYGQVRRVFQDMAIAIDHASHAVDEEPYDLSALPGLIQARGQRHVRGSRDVEQLLRQLPRHFVRSRGDITSAIMRNEVGQLGELEDYNLRFAGDAPDGELTWEQWNDPEIRARAHLAIEEIRQERMTAEERARAEREEQCRIERAARNVERAQWATATTQAIDGLQAGGLRIEVARDGATLARWGARMNNCIAGYSNSIGLDVLAAALDPSGAPVLNMQITFDRGLEQFLAVNNRDAHVLGDRAQRVLDALLGTGVTVSPYALGVNWLTYPHAKTDVQREPVMVGDAEW
jgi:hypothetical protein